MKCYTKLKRNFDLGAEVAKKVVKYWKSTDYGLMIQFKQLCLVINPTNSTQKKREVPLKIKYRKQMWENIMKHLPDPKCPEKPEGYNEYISYKTRKYKQRKKMYKRGWQFLV